MKIFRGRKTPVGCIVELDNESYCTKLSLEKSLQIADHSPDGFQWGDTFEISEFEIKIWLSLVGAKIEPPRLSLIRNETD